MYNLNKHMANILKAFVKGKISNTKNSTTFSNYTNIPIIDMLNIIKDYVSNDGQFTKKKAIAQDKFLDLVGLLGTLLILIVPTN